MEKLVRRAKWYKLEVLAVCDIIAPVVRYNHKQKLIIAKVDK
jgi:hypothetical protein